MMHPATPRDPRLANLRVEYSPQLVALIQCVDDNTAARLIAARFMRRFMPDLPAPNPFGPVGFNASAAAWFTSTARGDYNVARRKLRDSVHARVLAKIEARRTEAPSTIWQMTRDRAEAFA